MDRGRGRYTLGDSHQHSLCEPLPLHDHLRQRSLSPASCSCCTRHSSAAAPAFPTTSPTFPTPSVAVPSLLSTSLPMPPTFLLRPDSMELPVLVRSSSGESLSPRFFQA